MRRALFVIPLLALAPGLAAAQASGGEAVRVAFEEETLPNGLRVIYHVDRSAPVAAVNVWYNVGSKMEQEGRTGFAHLFEHMMFKGSRNVRDGQHFALLEDAGARAGSDINGTTNTDRTNYFETVPSNQVELAIWLESDRMGTLLDSLTQAKLDNQREVVKNERRQGVDNQPYGVWQERMLARVFPAGHPYQHPVIGSMDDLSAAALTDVQNFFRTYYAPNNAVLVIAGDIDVPQVRQMVRRHFGDIARGPAVPALRDMTLPATIGQGSREVIEDANAPAPAVYVGFRVPPARDPRGDAVQALTGMLSSRTGALFQNLVRGQQLATQVGAFNFGYVDGADLMVVIAVGKPGASADSLEAALMAQLDGVGATINAAALERIKATSRFGLVNGLQSMGGFGGRADVLAQGYTFYRDPNWINTRLQAIDAVTPAMVQSLVAERMVPANRAVLVFVPRPRPATAQVTP